MREDESALSRLLDVGRLEALTDGVFAIAITLLAIEIGVPHIESDRSGDLLEALVDQWPSYLAYAVTFFLIGAYWINHHRMFKLLAGVNHTFLVFNILFLMAIAIIPFPNAVLAEYLQSPELRGVAAALYGLAMVALAVTFNMVWWYAAGKGNLLRPDCDMVKVRKVLRSYLMGPVTYAVALAISLFAPEVALVIYLLVPMGYFLEGPVKHVEAGYMGFG
jgi:uncharacterized membrane protein